MNIETARLRVRDLRSSDAPALYAVYADPEVMRCIEPPFTRERTREFIETAGLCDPPLVYAVERKDGGAPVGHAIFHACEGDGDAFELGWVLSRALWGQGLATELTLALLAEAKRRGAHEAVLECVPEQKATARIVEKCGFTFAGSADGLLEFRKILTEGSDNGHPAL